MGRWKKQWRGVGGGWGFLEKSLSFPPTRQYFELQRKIKNDFYVLRPEARAAVEGVQGAGGVWARERTSEQGWLQTPGQGGLDTPEPRMSAP